MPKTASHWHQQEERNETESRTQIGNIKLVIAIFCLPKNCKLEPACAKVPEWSDRKRVTKKKDKRHITSRQKDGVSGLMKRVKRLRAGFQIMSRQWFLQRRRYSFPQKHTHTHIHTPPLVCPVMKRYWWSNSLTHPRHTHTNTQECLHLIWARRSIWFKLPQWHVVAELYTGNWRSNSSERGENSPMRTEVWG